MRATGQMGREQRRTIESRIPHFRRPLRRPIRASSFATRSSSLLARRHAWTVVVTLSLYRALLGVERVYCGPVSLGDGFVTAAHGVLPVPAPATLRLLEGHPVRPGPEGAGELVTPTGAALVRVMSAGQPPAQYVPVRSGFGAGTRDPRGRANALRLVLATAEGVFDDGPASGIEEIVLLAADLDQRRQHALQEHPHSLSDAETEVNCR